MSWDQLELELAEMFGEYTFRADEIELAYEARLAARKESAAEYHRDPWVARMAQARVSRWRAVNKDRTVRYATEWRTRNPDKAKENWRNYYKRRSARSPEWSREVKRKQRAKSGTPTQHTKTCSGCGIAGHNIRGCDQRRAA